MPSAITERPAPDERPKLGDLLANEPDGLDEVILLQPGIQSSVDNEAFSASTSATIPTSNAEVQSTQLVSVTNDISPPFSTVLISPQVVEKKKRVVRKVLNYRAVALNRDLFTTSNAEGEYCWTK